MLLLCFRNAAAAAGIAVTGMNKLFFLIHILVGALENIMIRMICVTVVYCASDCEGYTFCKILRGFSLLLEKVFEFLDHRVHPRVLYNGRNYYELVSADPEYGTQRKRLTKKA